MNQEKLLNWHIKEMKKCKKMSTAFFHHLKRIKELSK